MNTVQFPDRAQITEQAAHWIAVIDRGLTAGEELNLNEWLVESPIHGEVMVQLASMWDLLEILSPIAKLLPIDQNINPIGLAARAPRPDDTDTLRFAYRPNARRFAKAAGFGLLAAGLLLGVKMFHYGESDTNGLTPFATESIEQLVQPPVAQIYVTAIGERSNITLDDGSEIKLNTDSQISVQFSKHERRLVLSRGEAFFEVAKNPNRPFVVHTNNSRVTAVGTAFCVDVSDLEDTEVMVTEGQVKVDLLPHSSAGNTDKQMQQTTTSAPVYLSKGQKVLLNKRAAQISYSDDVDAALAWRDGIIIFTGQRLDEAINEIDRYIPLHFRITDEKIASIPVGGFFKTGDLDQLLLVLEQNFGVKSERIGDQILLSKAL